MPPSTPPDAPVVVLDTNVVFDWLVFRDPSCQAVAEAIEGGSIRWLAADAFREEFDDVIARGVGAARLPDPIAIERAWRRHAVLRPLVVPTPADRQRCRCDDPDDQKFIDLALAHRATWLLSRDRAVLKLAAEARRFGLWILPPSDWPPGR